MDRIERLQEALARAAQFASIATDWNLDHVQLTDGWVSVYDLEKEFLELSKGNNPPITVGRESEYPEDE